MTEKPKTGRGWSDVSTMLGNDRVTLGRHWSFNVRADPKRLPFVLSRYKFAAKMCGSGRRILELGCSEGIGAPILSEAASEYVGVDADGPAVAAAQSNWQSDHRRFVEADFLGRTFGEFDAIVSLDVIEHIYPDYEPLFVEAVWRNLGADGMCVVGTPNVTASAHASPASQAGHVNLFDAERLQTTLQRAFHNVFIFSMNDEIVHTGFYAMSHYLIAVACYKRAERL